MKALRNISTLVLLLIGFNAFAQEYALQFVETANSKAIDGSYDVKVQIMATESSFDLGLANLTFDYNTAGFYSQHSPDDGTKAVTLVQAHNFNSGGYSAMDVTEPQYGIVSVNVNYNFESSGNGDAVSLNTWTDVATLRFTIKDNTTSTNLVWRDDQAAGGINPVVVYNDAAPAVQIGRASTSGLNNPLPVTLLSFDAEKIGKDITLSWGTQVELNNDYFEVQRSTNQLDWQSLGRVTGAGTTIEEQYYSLTDYDVAQQVQGASVAFYRLLQVDYNGDFDYSQVETVQLDPVEEINLKVYPNPAQTTVSIASSVRGILYLYNAMGTLVKTTQNYQIDVSDLPQGMYTLQLSAQGQVQSTTLLVQ